MGAFFQQVFALLTTNPGVLAYNLVLAFSIMAALLSTLNFWQIDRSPMVRRAVLGLSILLALRLVLFLAAGLAWQKLLNSELTLPALERAVDLLGLLLIIWLWAFPENTRIWDLVFALLGVLVIAIWVIDLAVHFNLALLEAIDPSQVNLLSQAIALLLAAAGIVLLALRRPGGWPIGVVTVGIIGIGYLIQMLAPTYGEVSSGAIHLAQMVAYPLLIVLPQRFSLMFSLSLPEVSSAASIQAVEITAVNGPDSESKLNQVLQFLAVENDLEQAGGSVANVLARAMQADFCLLVTPPDNRGRLKLRFIYDLVHKQPVPAITLAAQTLPILTQAFQQGRALRLPGNSTAPDARSLARALDLKRSGPLLAVPIFDPGKSETIMQVVLISPYSNRNWTVDDQAYLTGIARPLILILYRVMLTTRLQDELLTAQQELQAVQEQQRQAEESTRGLMEMVNVLQKQIDGQHSHGKKQEGGASTSENRQVDEQNPGNSVESQFESKNLAT